MPDLAEQLRSALADRYAIRHELGSGGMAVVYLAEDLKHHRPVAVKVLRPELAAVLGAERFLKEIEVTANLQHPHILPLHDSGEADGFLFYVMPYVEGESLRQRLIREKQLPVDDAVAIAVAVASALDYAHRRDVIHRDIKPENILLHDGQPVVADFGIALAVRAAGGARLTETGLSLGTPHYMSPEQAMGDREVDARSDVYSLGCTLYEMLVGEPPYTGPTAQAVVAKLITETPRHVTAHRATVPPHVDAAVHKALEKLPADRFATAQQFADAVSGASPLGAAVAGTLPMTQAAPPDRRALRSVFRWLPWGVAAVAVVAAIIGLTRPGPAPRVVRFFAMPPFGVVLETATGTDLAVSPDGTQLVYRAVNERGEVRLYLKAVNQLETQAIPGTASASAPFFSPDGEWIGFLADQRLRKVALSGGPASTITQVPGDMRGASWGDDGFIVFAPASGGGLSRVPAVGGDPVVLTEGETDGADHRWPYALPGGRGALFTIFTTADEAELAVVSYATGEVRRLVRGTAPVYVAGYLVFGRPEGGESAMFAAPFDVDRLELTGSPVPLLEGVLIKGGGAGEYALSADGSLAYVSGRSLGRTLVLVGRDGVERPLDVDPGDYHSPRFSPDGRRLAVAEGRGSGHDVWTYEFARGAHARRTFEGVNLDFAWTDDGQRIVYGVFGSGLFSRAADGSGTVEQLSASRLAPVSLIQGGRSVLAWAQPGDVWILPLTSGDTAHVLLDSPFREVMPALSPDGTLLAYSSNESGTYEVYVQAFPGLGGRRQVSTTGGTEPLWSKDGSELFYRAPLGLVSVSVERSPNLVFGDPLVLFADSYLSDGEARWYDVHPDGTQFVFVKPGAAQTPMVMVLNWLEEVRGNF